MKKNNFLFFLIYFLSCLIFSNGINFFSTSSSPLLQNSHHLLSIPNSSNYIDNNKRYKNKKHVKKISSTRKFSSPNKNYLSSSSINLSPSNNLSGKLTGLNLSNEKNYESTLPSSSNSIPNSYHSLSLKELLIKLNLNSTYKSVYDLIYGLKQEEAEKRLRIYGENSLPKREKKGIIARIKEELKDYLVRILLSVAVLSTFISIYDEFDELKKLFQFKNYQNIFLFFKSFFTNLIKLFFEPFTIFLILIINGVINISQGLQAEKALDELQENLSNKEQVLVRRNGKWIGLPSSSSDSSLSSSLMPSRYLVPGDIIMLKGGDRVPADCRVLVSAPIDTHTLISLNNEDIRGETAKRLLRSIDLSSSSNILRTDESCLTGESLPVNKINFLSDNKNINQNLLNNINDLDSFSFFTSKGLDSGTNLASRSNMLYSGTLVSQGSCIALVVSTGKNTEIGKIQSMINSSDEDDEAKKTPLTLQLDNLSYQLSKTISWLCISIWFLSIPKFNNKLIFANKFQGAIHYLKFAIALGVASIPEGLPAIITMMLSLSSSQMSKLGMINRNLKVLEKMGSASVICTDKTGTLTTSKMTVTNILTFEDSSSNSHSIILKENEIEGISYNPQGDIKGITKKSLSTSPTWLVTSLISTLCNDAHLQYQPNPIQERKNIFQFNYIGEPTEAALKVLSEKIFNANNKVTLKSKNSSNKSINNNDNLYLDPSDFASRSSNYWSKSFTRLFVLPFTRGRKSMSVLVRGKNFSSSLPSSLQENLLGKKKEPSNQDFEGDQEKKNIKKNRLVNNKNFLIVKGAAEMILARSSRLLLSNGEIVPLTEKLRAEINEKLLEMAKRPLRCLAMAYKDHESLPQELQYITDETQANEFLNDFKGFDLKSTEEKNSTNESDLEEKKYLSIEDDLIFVSVGGIRDPPRPGIKDSISTCKEAGVRVMMITGDSKPTAVSIAKEVGILSPPSHLNPDSSQYNDWLNEHAFTTKEFFSYSHEKQVELLRNYQLNKLKNIVFCRAAPEDKLKLVNLLEKEESLNEVTIMTGDGVNDAPALKHSSIGISMGQTGSDVARDASDIILSDDNFNNIIHGITKGRQIFNNLQSCINFLLSSNFAEIMTLTLAMILNLPELLTPIHLLWINLVTDGPPATSFSFNPPSKNLMKVPPIRRKLSKNSNSKHDDQSNSISFFTPKKISKYLLTSVYVSIATIGVFLHWYRQHGISFSQVINWDKCKTWGEKFAHSACAPIWSKDTACNIFFPYSQTSPSCGSQFSNIKSLKDLSNYASLNHPQTLALTTIVLIEFFKAICSMSPTDSLFSLPPWSNPWLLPSILGPFALHLIVMYNKSLSKLMKVYPLNKSDWSLVLLYSVPIIILEEFLKFINRN